MLRDELHFIRKDNAMITFKYKGDFSHTEAFFAKSKKANVRAILDKYGRLGVAMLTAATPVETGKTACSWVYEVENTKDGWSIYWSNTNVVNHVNIALILQYGHGTGTGGYVQGRDYINPALQPVFDKMTEEILREVGA